VGEHEGHEGYLWMGSVDTRVAGGGPTTVTVTCQWWQWCSGELQRAGSMGNRWRIFKELGASDFGGQLERREAEGRAQRGMVEQQQWRATVVSGSATVS
jgi:hypothetical protein